ncbi:uncharacterized protein LOC111830175 [Capsella rubella]|uniref:uncharacterized protein LOC111830175 n=1 Tax=Capsella rubella TaxID=81985 RepID=UPI000CD50BD5|nr:uncharacterized protein LOC111830175 [Capsella rubella]
MAERYYQGEDPHYRHMKEAKRYMDRLYAVADSDWGIPLQCPCGEHIVEETSPTEIEKKRYFTCVHYKDDGLHKRKYWVDAIEEDAKSLRKDVEEHTTRLREYANHDFLISQMKLQLEGNAKEISYLKDVVSSLVGRIELLEKISFK